MFQGFDLLLYRQRAAASHGHVLCIMEEPTKHLSVIASRYPGFAVSPYMRIYIHGYVDRDPGKHKAARYTHLGYEVQAYTRIDRAALFG